MNRKLIRERERKGLSQQALADQVGIHQTTLSGIERGKIRPTPEAAQKIASILGVGVRDIFVIQTVEVFLPALEPDAEAIYA